MKIAVPITSSNQVDEHFGHCESYNVYSISSTNEIAEVESIKAEEGCGCKSNIATVLAQYGVTTMLAGGIGTGAINVLGRSGIEVVRGCSGNAEQVVKQFIEGSIADSGISCQQHGQHHGDGHQCNH